MIRSIGIVANPNKKRALKHQKDIESYLLKRNIVVYTDRRLSRKDVVEKSDLIINIANWPKKRVEHWNTLLKARAIENQLFIAGINRVGIDKNNLEYEESTNIYNANGDIVKFEVFKDMKIYKIDKEFTEEFKNKFNTIDDRKIEFYKGII